MSTFAAIDFETANYSPDSACAIGLVVVKDSRTDRREHYLIRPTDRQFVFTYLHGITSDDVRDAPTFAELWPTLRELITERKKMKSKGLVLTGLVIGMGLVLVLVGCVPPPQQSNELNVLCTPQEEWCQGMTQEFESKFGITVNYVRMSSSEALARLQAEKANPQFDIWWGGPIDSYVAAKYDGLLQAYDSPSYENLIDAEKYKDPDNYWAGIYVGTLGFCTNKDWLAANPGVEPPTSWEDLLKPEFKGQVMVAHPSTSGTSYTALATVLQQWWAWFNQGEMFTVYS